MSGPTAIWLDGETATALPLPDRGLDFGDGVFETLLIHRGKPLFLELHLRRLQRGLKILAFPECDAVIREQLAQVQAVITANGWLRSALRVTVTRGAGPRGYAPPVASIPRIIISATEISMADGGAVPPAALALAKIRWPTQPALAGLKHLNRLEQVLAAAECRAAGADEIVMLDQAENVISVASGNLFVAIGGRLLTPAITQCGIAGTRRSLIIQRWAPAIGLAVEEVTLSQQILEGADEVFYTNSLVGLRSVSSFGTIRWKSHAIHAALYRQYEAELT